jgi:hypothetical protein
MQTYQPPANTYDQPFYYIFDGSPLTDGVNALNQSISLDPGIGDFILRRAVGWTNLINNSIGGQYLLKDYSKNPLSAEPLGIIGGPPNDDGLFPREQWYPATGKIPFDLINVLRAQGGINPLATAQVAFMGVRRQKGSLPNIRPPYRYRTIPFSYIGTINVTQAPGPNQIASQLFVPVNDYDFELLELRISYLPFPTLGFRDGSGLVFVGVKPGVAFSVTIGGPGPINQAFALRVTGNNIVITPQTNGAGLIITTVAQLVAAYDALPAALLVATIAPGFVPGFTIPTTAGVTITTGTGITVPSNLHCSLLVYDAVRFQISNIPFNDVYLNRLGPYQNGAIVPALLYTVSTSLHIDFLSQNANVPFQAFVEFVGRNRIPC